MGLRLPLRRSTSFTPDHPALMEMPGPTALKLEANVLIMGADNVGKSALTVRFLTRRFIGEYGDMEFLYSHNLTMDGREILFHIWDVPNSQEQAEEGSSEEKRIQWADSFVLVYSICDRASFNILPLKIQFIKAAKEGQSQEKVPIVIVGNKRDLHHQRVVSSEEGRLLALSLDCGFYEVSAAEAYHGALMVFHGLAERIPDTKLALKKGTGIRGIVKTMSAVFAPFQCSQPFPLCKHHTDCAWEKPDVWLVPRTGIAPCAFPSRSICKSACPWGGREVGKGVAGLIAEPFCCWEAFPCLSRSPFPWEGCVRTLVSAVRCNKLFLAGSPWLLGAVNLYLEHGKRHVVCWAWAPTMAAARMSFPWPWVGCLTPLCSPI
uniref:small monomeric GTPase n=1 Tax=Melopsittacus undulatus TaxID=13146 RepID=A0A8V5GXB1_MELUD